MIDAPVKRYAHWSKGDGSWNSICLNCFRTAATAADEAGLADGEAIHKCNSQDRSGVSLRGVT